MKKRSWIFFLIICMVFALLPFGVFAENFPANPVQLPIGGKAYAADGWYRFAPTSDGLYTLTPADSHARFAIYQTKMSPADFANAEQQIADGERQLNDGRLAVQEGDATFAAGKATYDEAVARYEQNLAQHELSRAEYERNLSLVDLPGIGESAREIVAAFEKEEADLEWTAAVLQAEKEELDRAEQMLKDAHRQIAEGEAQLQAAKDFLAASKAGKTGEPVMMITHDNEMLRQGLFWVHAGSEYLIHVETDGDPSLNCSKVSNVFVDVPTDAYYLNPVYWAAANRITFGTDETHFSPDASCTRAQVVTFLWRDAGSPKVSVSCPFADVPSDAYYSDAVRWAISNGITKGTDESHFSPEEPCTRAQVATFLWRAHGEPNVITLHTFSDVPEDAYYSHAVSWALFRGITNGTDLTHFSPDDTCTRAQVVTFLYRASR